MLKRNIFGQIKFKNVIYIYKKTNKQKTTTMSLKQKYYQSVLVYKFKMVYEEMKVLFS